ncbi:MAG: hypothetical protein ACXWUG_21400 [Polyangiales bacterium]
MEEPFWKRLVEDLTKQGWQNPSLERLREKLPGLGGGQRSLEMEIAQEMAAALGRAGEKVDIAIVELEALGRACDAAVEPEGRSRAVAAFNAKREHAEKVLWELRVHREALGIRNHAQLARFYVIPPRRT